MSGACGVCGVRCRPVSDTLQLLALQLGALA